MKPRARIKNVIILGRKSLFLLALMSALPVWSQVNTATVMGGVQDSSGANIPGAGVKLINTQTGTENDAITSNKGSFFLSGVIPGSYTLQIKRGGFATTQLNGISLNVGDTKSLFIRMKIGSVLETITVDASGSTLNTADATVSTVIDRRFVESIPLNGRSLQDLISTTPGIVTQSPQAAGERGDTQGEFSVNGQQPASNTYFVDGVSVSYNPGASSDRSRISTNGSAAGATALGTTQSLVSIDALQEFRVLSSTYSAEYGRTPGGQFTFSTRSGTNAIHGSLYEYWRHYSLDAADWFSNSMTNAQYPQVAYHQNDFGGVLGGPVMIPHFYNGGGRTFFFSSYEGLFLEQPTPQTFQYAPAWELRTNLPNEPQPLLRTFPTPPPPEIVNSAGNPTGLGQVIFVDYELPARVNATSFRVDHTFSPNLSVFLRYGDTPSYSDTRQLWSFTVNRVRSRTITSGVITQLSADIGNDFRLGFSDSNGGVATTTVPINSGGTAPSLNSGLGIPDVESVSAQVYFHMIGAGDSAENTDSEASFVHQWNLRDTLSIQAAHHLIKMGIDQLHVSSNVNPAALYVQAEFFDRNAIVDNSVSDVVVTKNNPVNPILNDFSAFAEDEWRLTKSLNVSIGLRLDVDAAPKGKDGQDPFAVRGDINAPATLTLAPRGTPLWHTGWFNLAPRVGAAWIPYNKPGNELIVRGGAGVYYDTAARAGLRAFDGIGFRTSAHYSNVPLPVTPAQLTFSTDVVPPYINSVAFAFPSHLQLPYSLQWNFDLEKALGKNQSITVSYVGASGHRLLQEQRMNVSQLNPDFGDLSYFPAGVTSNYQAMQARFQRSFSRGIEALASYTWGHALDFGSTDPINPLVYGNSDLDVRQNAEAAITWDFPKPGQGTRFRRIRDNWGLDGRLIARSGFPVNLEGNLSIDPITGDTYYSGVNLIPHRPLYLHGSEFPGHRSFNGGPDALSPAFSLPDRGSLGNAPRNLLRGFNAVQANGTIRRDFHVTDRLDIQFGAEIFNVFNHPNFGYVDPGLTDLLFGQATKMLNQSFGNSGALYEQGGPRSIQISGKLVF